MLAPPTPAAIPHPWPPCVQEAPALYRPRHRERTCFYQLLDAHFETYAREHSERFEERHGPLRAVVGRSVEQCLDFGRYASGFARRRCANCKAGHLLAWQHSGSSVHVGDVIEPTHRESRERLGRYVARAPIALSKVHVQEDGCVRLRTPPDPQTRKESRIFDPLAWVHAVTRQIPDPYQHLVRYYGAYSCRARRLYRPAETEVEEDVVPKPNRDGASRAQDEATAAWRRSWARLLRRIYEVDPLTCPRCSHPLKVVAVITDPVVVERILAHRRHKQMRSPFESRAPPAPVRT